MRTYIQYIYIYAKLVRKYVYTACNLVTNKPVLVAITLQFVATRWQGEWFGSVWNKLRGI